MCQHEQSMQQIQNLPISLEHRPSVGSFTSSPSARSMVSTAPSSNSASNSRQPPRKKIRLTDIDRKRICEYHLAHPKVKQDDIAQMFGVERSTISKVLRCKEKYLSIEESAFGVMANKQRGGKFPELEKTLSVWARNVFQQGGILSDSLIRDKAKELAHAVGISEVDFKASSGWIENFKFRNMIKRGKIIEEEDEGPPDMDEAMENAHNMNQLEHLPIFSPIREEPSNAILQSPIRMDGLIHDHMRSNDPQYQPGNLQHSMLLRSQSTTSTSPVPSVASSDRSRRSRRSSISIRQPYQNPRQGHHLRSHSHQALNFPHSVSPVSNPVTPTIPQMTAEQPSAPMSVRYPSPPSTSRSQKSSDPCLEEATRALEVVMGFLKHQPVGYVDVQDYLVIGKLLGKLESESATRRSKDHN
ncbi:hypothetical protein SAICODRAFT_31616 [Saitoella complicata NRRL Y-17804]|nr:uncharacterized protein SAICODRAFT_31616 [Saitoella complicata NRRL Y-17804]ODQ50840.1 hypothetical protein SAICODRAFT_31616 [Saitoella complicata NRRL Y-17804]